MPRQRWPRRSKKLEPPDVPQPTLDLLTAYVKHRADELGIGASRLATREDVARFACSVTQGNSKDARLLHGWRWDCAGRDLEAILQGKLSLRVRKHRIEPIR